MLKNIAYNGDGTHRQTMDPDRALNTIPSTKAKWQQTSREEPKGSIYRYFVDAENSRTPEKPAATPSPAPDMHPLLTGLSEAEGIRKDPIVKIRTYHHRVQVVYLVDRVSRDADKRIGSAGLIVLGSYNPFYVNMIVS